MIPSVDHAMVSHVAAEGSAFLPLGGRVALSLTVSQRMADQIATEAARRGMSVELWMVVLLARALNRPDPLAPRRGPRVR